jgi:hypothetical protein
MGITFGFDDDAMKYQHGRGFFGGLGAGVNAVLQGGGIGAFMDPIPYLQQQDQERAKADFAQVRETLQPQYDSFLQAVRAGNNQAAAEVLYHIADIYQRAGYDPKDALQPLLALQQGAELARLRGIDIGDPETVARQLMGFSRTAGEAADIYRSGELNKATEADIARTQQLTRQEEQLFPYKLHEQQLMPSLRQAEIGAAQAQRGEIGARTNLLGSQTEQTVLENQFMREHGGFKPGAVNLDSGQPRRDLVNTVDEHGNPITLDRNTGQSYPRYEDPMNKIFRESMGQQAGAAAKPAMSAHELTLDQIKKMPDEQLGQLHIDEQRLTASQRALVERFRQEALNELPRLPVAQRRAKLAEIQRRLILELSTPEAPR